MRTEKEIREELKRHEKLVHENWHEESTRKISEITASALKWVLSEKGEK